MNNLDTHVTIRFLQCEFNSQYFSASAAILVTMDTVWMHRCRSDSVKYPSCLFESKKRSFIILWN